MTTKTKIHKWEQCPAQNDHVSWSERCRFQKGHGNEPHSWESEYPQQVIKEREEARKEAAKLRTLVAQATTTALATFARLGDVSVYPTVSALELIRKEARLDPYEVEYETVTVTIPKATARALERAIV